MLSSNHGLAPTAARRRNPSPAASRRARGFAGLAAGRRARAAVSSRSSRGTVNGALLPAQLVTMTWTGPVAASAGACTLIGPALMYSTNPALALVDTLLPAVRLSACRRNIEKREDSHFGAVNNLLEIFEIIGPRGSTIAACGDA